MLCLGVHHVSLLVDALWDLWEDVYPGGSRGGFGDRPDEAGCVGGSHESVPLVYVRRLVRLALVEVAAAAGSECSACVR